MRLLSKMNVTDVANPLDKFRQYGIAETDTKTIVLLGNIVGMASGLSYRKNNFGDVPSVALTGIFEAIPLNGDGEIDGEGAQAPSLFMPQAIQAMLVEAMLDGAPHPVTSMPKAGSKTDVSAKQMKIMFQVGARRNAAVGGAGYEFVVSQIGSVAKVDVLEALKLEVASGKPAQLAAPRERAQQLAAPRKGTKKAAKK